MQRILFVDDEQRLLDGLARLLRPSRSTWDMTFVLGGAAAIAALDAEQFDVVLCDMRMPDIDGLAVLEHARERTPRTVRIALSGQTDLDAMSRSLAVVHQFLSKPCSPSMLRSAIERACGLKRVLEDAALQEVVGRMVELPALPQTYVRFTEAIENPDVSIHDIVKIVEQDVALSARCLQLANSAYFGLRRHLDTLDQAVVYLGISTLRVMVLSSAVFSSYSDTGTLTHAELEQLERHSVLVAHIAKQIPDNEEMRQQAFIAGMLHDIGRLILASPGPGQSDVQASAPGDCGSPVPTAVTHAEVGAYLLGLWGFPMPIVEAVAFHHHPERTSPSSIDVLGAVYIANELVLESSRRPDGERGGDPSRLETYLESLGSAHRLPEFRASAACVIGATGE